MDLQGSILGVDFWIEEYPADGFRLRLNNGDTNEVLFDRRLIGYTHFDGLWLAVADVWADQLKQYPDTSAYELTQKIARCIQIQETEEN